MSSSTLVDGAGGTAATPIGTSPSPPIRTNTILTTMNDISTTASSIVPAIVPSKVTPSKSTANSEDINNHMQSRNSHMDFLVAGEASQDMEEEDEFMRDCPIIGDCYVIRHQIGNGSFGSIYYATHKTTNEPVAIKVEPADTRYQLYEEYVFS